VDKDDFLGERKHALEEAFFKKQEQEQLAKLRAELDRKTTREELARATGIADQGALDVLLELGVSGQTSTALALAPLLRVAWADGEVQQAERDAILESARSRGVVEGSPAHTLLMEWLTAPPDPSLDAAWEAYARALVEKMTAEQRLALRDQVVGFARGVAEAAGGFLGMKKISSAEEAALAAIARAFD
jgi:uncharacterized tellurite resistance protein B-like protein